MGSGKSHGHNRNYQVFVRDILCRVNPELTPYCDDGIDVTLNVESAGGNITFDILLKDDNGNLIVGECKRWKFSIKQSEIFAFQTTLTELRNITGKTVSGMFFVKSVFQLGAVKFADYYGIKVITCNERQPLESFSLANLHFDHANNKQIRQGEAHLSGNLGISGVLTSKIQRGIAGEWIDVE